MLCLICLGGCRKDIHDHPKLFTGQQLFEHHCSGCHKNSGAGNFLAGVPANRGSQLSTDQITHKITTGTEDSKMPAFPGMPANEAAAIALTPVAPIADQPQLFARLDGMWVGAQNPQQGVFFGEAYRNADLDFGITFPDTWETMNTPRFVAAAEPDGGAYLVLSSSESEETIFEIADGLAENMRDEAGIEPSEDRTLTVGSWPARLLRYDDSSAEKTVSLYYLLVQSPQLKFVLMAMGYEEFRDTLGAAALTLRPLTQPERDSIGGLRMRVTKPQAGDSLAAINERMGSKWPLPLSAGYNGLATPNAPVIGRLIKYSRTERYTPGP